MCYARLQVLDEKNHQVLVADRSFPGRDDAVADAGAVEEAENADPHHVETRMLVLHSHSGNRCTCKICAAAEQRRDFAEAGSHPHSEDRCATTPGTHSFGDVPTYVDSIDYGAAQYFNGGHDAICSVPTLALEDGCCSRSPIKESPRFVQA